MVQFCWEEKSGFEKCQMKMFNVQLSWEEYCSSRTELLKVPAYMRWCWRQPRAAANRFWTALCLVYIFWKISLYGRLFLFIFSWKDKWTDSGQGHPDENSQGVSFHTASCCENVFIFIILEKCLSGQESSVAVLFWVYNFCKVTHDKYWLIRYKGCQPLQ